MASESAKLPSPIPELARLLVPGVLGHYTHFEATEIFAIVDGREGVINVFTVMVGEEQEIHDATDAQPRYLNPKPIGVKGLPGWSFGVRRYLRPIAELLPALEAVEAGEPWQSYGQPLLTADLRPMPFQFVPADNGTPVPLNHALKNNFWNGSHLFEWSDHKKAALRPFFENPPRLQALTEEIQKYAPISLAALSDRLGNLIVQLPVTVVLVQFNRLRQSGDFQVELAWHPKAIIRSLQAVCQLEHDEVVTGHASVPVDGQVTLLPMRSGRGLHRGFIWDEENKVLLAATGPASFISTISFNLQTSDPEPRVFTVKLPDGLTEERRVGLVGISSQNIVGDPLPDDNGGWTAKRMYKERAEKLAQERRFVQYRPRLGQSAEDHDQALGDLRRLIIQNGKAGAWLWDPFLGTRDVLETLFYCPYPGADLRALTSSGAGRPEDLRLQFAGVQSNWRGLRLEYRIRRNVGWDFHDRFLIFPGGDDGALAWSLGTSVNGVGKAHHILQRVDNGQLVMDAFVELWNILDGPDHLIWKRP